MWFHVLSVVAVRSMSVRDPNWGTLGGAFLGPLVDQWDCKQGGVQMTNAEYGGCARCEWGRGASNPSMLLDVSSTVAPTRRSVSPLGNAECAELMGKWIGMNGQEVRATACAHFRDDKCITHAARGRQGAAAWGGNALPPPVAVSKVGCGVAEWGAGNAVRRRGIASCGRAMVRGCASSPSELFFQRTAVHKSDFSKFGEDEYADSHVNKAPLVIKELQCIGDVNT